MASVKNQPSALCFSSDIGDIVFGTNSESGILQLDIVHGTDRETLLEETMYPSVDGSVVISDISSLVEPYARQYLQVQVECTFTDDNGSVGIDPVTVLFAMADVGTSAADFTSSHFLTVLNGEKVSM